MSTAAVEATGATQDGGLRAGHLARRAFWGVGDQALSSLTNFALGVVVARTVGPADFGAFSLVFATYLVFMTLSRALASEPLAVRYSAQELDRWARGAAASAGTALVVGGLFGLGCMAAAPLIGGSIGQAVFVLGLFLPVLLLQDAWRYVFFAGGRGRDAFINDLVWAIELGILLVAVAIAGASDVGTFVLVWAVGAAVAAAYGIRQAGFWPAPRQAAAWLREQSDIAPRFAVETLILSGTQQLTLYAIGAFSGLAAVGGLRAGQLLLNAMHVVTFGIQLAAIPEAVRVLQRSSRAFRRLCVLIAVGLSAMSLSWGLVLLLLPDSIGRVLLGATWLPAREVLLPLTVLSTVAAAQAGAFVGLRALAAARRSLRARALSATLYLVGGVAGAWVGGAVGAAWGMAVGFSVGSIYWWFEFIVAFRRHEASRPAPSIEVHAQAQPSAAHRSPVPVAAPRLDGDPGRP